MSDLISRGKLFNLLAPVQTLGEAYGIIQEMPTVDAVPVVHGHWIPCYPLGDDGTEGYMCSVCHVGGWEKTNFCPHCGARNIEGEDES